ncbi:hypothetical protein [Gottfriedia acidiceleris]|uniref:hypothetical protein n=1 Tax=Gottfriedia acidiceleris TaxID=371036 RepID=UPI002FFDAE49
MAKGDVGKMIIGLFLGIIIGLFVFGFQFLISEKKTYEKPKPPTEFELKEKCESHYGDWINGKCYHG